MHLQRILPYLLLSLLVVLVLGIFEHALHARRLRKIRIRIHVNGTRGKSSVTRLIAAGLRAGGVRTCAKTTGTLPRMVMPDGSEYPVFRPSRASILEQLRIVSAAVANGCEALVIECMALHPYLQFLCEARLVRSTIGVVTNVRADHLDVMGPEERHVALAIAGSTPIGAKLFTSERRHLAELERAAADRKTALVRVSEAETAAVTPEELSRFSYIEHAENVALALAVCAELGVDRSKALDGMWAAAPDPGVMVDLEIAFFGRRIVFVNGFAANDPESTELVWGIAIDRHPDLARRVAVFNCRGDRPDRSAQLGRACTRWQRADRIVLVGTGTAIFARAAVVEGIDPSCLVFADDRGVDDIFEIIIEQAGEAALVVGMGNIGGVGLDLVRYFRNRSTLPRAA